MNERIQKIANESFQYASEQSGLFTSKFMEHYDQKFAELIVGECIDELKALRKNYDTHRDVEPEENSVYIDAFLQA